MNRRSFVKKSLAAGGGLVASEMLRQPLAFGAKSAAHAPNILYVMVDQQRSPQWFPDQAKLDALLPGQARIRNRAVSFENHFTATNMCTAARGALLTGLYPHQTGCMLTNIAGGSTLSSQFPTWGSMLRREGYETFWWGKWHLGDEGDTTQDGLEPYGFSGGTYPSPNGGPRQGLMKDPGIVDQFSTWFAEDAAKGPWCTTVSLVNPHDIMWWPRFTPADDVLSSSVDYDFAGGPPNTETPAQLEASKPRLQRALQESAEVVFGPVPYEGDEAASSWAQMMKTYLWYDQQVDAQIGRVLDVLESKPEIAAKTVVVFTADHGEYAGSHGLRGKGASVYEEAIKVPLYVYDPRGLLGPKHASKRTQMTSSVDIAPLLLTIGKGSDHWRGKDRYSHLAHRADIAAIARNRKRKGRPWIAHVTDETFVEEASYTFVTDEAPWHVASVRTRDAKYATYSRWTEGTQARDTSDQDHELYDRKTAGGRLELDNIAGKGSALEKKMSNLLSGTVLPREVEAHLPDRLRAAQEEGYANYKHLSEAGPASAVPTP